MNSLDIRENGARTIRTQKASGIEGQTGVSNLGMSAAQPLLPVAHSRHPITRKDIPHTMPVSQPSRV
jgi:hypothetical protein